MCRYLFITILWFSTLMAAAQTRTTIKGKVIDSISKSPIEYATVAILNAKDTTAAALITYAQTDKDGEFKLYNLPVTVPLKVIVTFAGSKSYVRFFSMAKGQTLDMTVIPLASRLLNEVTVRAERMPITVSKDTIEYDATAFKTRPNALVEDLLKKLPGVQVDNRGKITVMGHDVKKVLIDGREFFASDPRIATKNLDAEMIAKVQVYDDREDDPNHMIADNRVDKIINLKFKRELKKATFGKLYGGLGTQDHYQTGGLLNTFRDTLQVSLLAATNNLNNTGFDYSDLSGYGGTNRGGDAFGGLGYGRGANGKQTATSAGVNINTDYGKKLKVNLNYLFKHTKLTTNTLTNRQQVVNDTIATTASMSDRLSNSDNHQITASIFYKPSEATQFKYNPNLTISKNDGASNYNSTSFTNFINPINSALNRGDYSNDGINFNQNFNYLHYLKKKGSTFIINHNLTYNPGNNGHNFQNDQLSSYLATLPSYTLRRLGNDENRNSTGGLSEQYHNTLSKAFSIDLNATTDFANELNKTSTYDYNPVTGEYDSFVLMLSNDLHRVKWSESLSPAFNYKLSKALTLSSTLTTQFQTVRNVFNRNSPDINQSFTFFLPLVNLRLNSFNVSYSRYARLPNIGDMIPYTVVFNPQSSVTGNPYLKPTTSDNFNINYNSFNFREGVSYSFNASANFEQNSVVRQRTINSQLIETSMPINRNGKYSYGLRGYYSKQIRKKDQLQATLSTNFFSRVSHDFFVINHQDGFQDSYSTNFSEAITLNYKDVIQIEPTYSLTHVYTTYTGVDYNAQSNVTHSAETHFLFILPKRFNIEGSYNYMYNPRVPPGYQRSSNFVNLNIARSFLKKDRGEIKLSCYDLLNQNISSYRYINENNITDTQSQIIKRYFMVTLQWRFNKSASKGDPPSKKTIPMRFPIF